MGQACKTHGNDEKSIHHFCQKTLKGRVHLDQGIGGRIILKLHVAIESADGSEYKWRSRRTTWRPREEYVDHRNLAYEIRVVSCCKHTNMFKTCFVCFGLYAVLS